MICLFKRQVPFLRRTRQVASVAIFLLLAGSQSLPALWLECLVTNSPGSGVTKDTGAADNVWGCFWYLAETTNDIYVVYSTAPFEWKAQKIAGNGNASKYNTIAVDSVNHWKFYSAYDGYIWVAYFTGSNWVSTKVGSHANSAYQLCVDPVWHICWYLDGSGNLWRLYWDGSAWSEVPVGSDLHLASSRGIGVDPEWHTVWNLSLNKKKVLYTSWTGSGWTTGALSGSALDLSLSSHVFGTLAVSGKGHVIYLLELDSGGIPQELKAGYYAYSSWNTWPVMKDGNLPTDAGYYKYLVPGELDYICYLGSSDVAGNYRCLCASYSTLSRSWSTGRLDDEAVGSTLGLFPVASGWNGRAFLCLSSNTNLPRILQADQP